MALTHWVFPRFLKRTVNAVAVRHSVVFWSLFVREVSLLAGDMPVSRQFWKVHCPSPLPITYLFQ